MGKPLKPIPVKLIIGIISSDTELLEKTKKMLSQRFGTVDKISPLWDFNQTDYYKKEMGDYLKRVFISFEKLVNARSLVEIKYLTNSLEKKLSKNKEKRCVNIDPGYLTLSKLILATTKNFSHRIYIDRGIFEEITLFFKNGSFTHHNLTYPDYRQQNHIDLFNEIRKKYYEQIENIYGLSSLSQCL